MSFLIAAAVGLTGASLFSSNKARKEQKKAAKAQAAINRRKNKREMLKQQRQAMIERANIIAMGALSGASDSSSVQGGVSSVQSQLTGNLNYMQELSQMGGAVTEANIQAQRYAGQANMFSTLASTAAAFATPTAPAAAPAAPTPPPI